MRKKFVFFVLIPLIVLGIVVYIFVDSWVESGLEAAGEALVGARVEIDDLDVTLAPVGIQWARIQVANPRDPWKNFFETGTVRFAMDFGQLLRNKYIIETAEVNNLIIGSRRTTDGSLPEGAREKTSAAAARPSFTALAQEVLDKTVEQTPVFNFDNLRKGINVDSLVNALDIQTLKHIDSLKLLAVNSSRQWDAAVTDLEASKARLIEIETNIKAIDPSRLKGIDKITSAISTVDNSVKGLNEIRKTFDDRRASVTNDVERISSSVGTIDDVARSDFQKLLSMARLPNLNTTGIAQLLVGKEMYDRAMSYLYWVDFARTNIKKYTPEPEKEQPPRFKGQDIHFPVARGYPKLWIKKVLASGGTDTMQQGDHIRARGEALNISSDQSVTGVPLTLSLEGTEGGGRSFNLAASFDRTKDTPFDQYRASLSGVPLAEFRLGRSDFLPTRITGARMSTTLSVSVPGDLFDSRTRLDFNNVEFRFETEPRNVLERLVRDVLAGIQRFNVGLRLWNTGGKFDVAISTDLADQIAGRAGEVLGAEFRKLQSDLRAKLDAKLSEKRQELERIYSEKKKEIEKQLAAYEAMLTDKLGLVESKKKELTDRLEKEKKGKVDDALKKIFK